MFWSLFCLSFCLLITMIGYDHEISLALGFIVRGLHCVWCSLPVLQTEEKQDELMDVAKQETTEVVKDEASVKATKPPPSAGKPLRYEDLPSQPSILVYPSRTAKGGRFDCSVMSLSLLLDYRQEDNKEHSFEVSQTWHCSIWWYYTMYLCQLIGESLYNQYGTIKP